MEHISSIGTLLLLLPVLWLLIVALVVVATSHGTSHWGDDFLAPVVLSETLGVSSVCLLTAAIDTFEVLTKFCSCVSHLLKMIDRNSWWPG